MPEREEDAPHVDAEVAMLQDQVTQLRRALESRDVIGQAKGIIMHSLGCTPDEAFDVLVQQSRAENRKLIDVASHLVARSSRTARSAGEAASPPVASAPQGLVFTHRDGDGPPRQLVDHGHDGGSDQIDGDGDDHRGRSDP